MLTTLHFFENSKTERKWSASAAAGGSFSLQFLIRQTNTSPDQPDQIKPDQPDQTRPDRPDKDQKRPDQTKQTRERPDQTRLDKDHT